jgi:hypothetical protein
MADDWTTVFGKSTMQGMSLPVAKSFAGYDSNHRADRVSFGALLGITSYGVDYLDGFNGPDVSAIAAVSDDEDEAPEPEPTPTPDTVSSPKRKSGKAKKKLNKFTVPKEDEVAKFLGKDHMERPQPSFDRSQDDRRKEKGLRIVEHPHYYRDDPLFYDVLILQLAIWAEGSTILQVKEARGSKALRASVYGTIKRACPTTRICNALHSFAIALLPFFNPTSNEVTDFEQAAMSTANVDSYLIHF